MRDHADSVPGTSTLGTLAEQLRDGPLHELMEVHRRARLLSDEGAASDGEQLQQLLELAVVSLSAMERFHAFTRELRAQIAALTATPTRDLH